MDYPCKNGTDSLNTTRLTGRRSILKGLSLFFAAGTFSFLPRMAYAAPEQHKILIVYFSHTGNTRTVAQQIHSVVGGDMLELQTVQPYPTEHSNTVRQAEQEQENNFHPQLSTQFTETIDAYDVIFVGYPVWAYTIPMALHSFFDRFTFPGKTLVPFSTHQGSRLADGPEQIAQRCPQATVLKGLAVRGPRVANAQQEVGQWIQSLGFTTS